MKTKFSITLFTLLNLSIMAKEIKTQITINQTPEKVWSILTNFNDYGRWNPFIVSITGKPLVGNILVVVMKLQEKSIIEIMEQAKNIKIGLGIGSSFDYFIGFQKRAPKFFRSLGIEWLYRIFSHLPLSA